MADTIAPLIDMQSRQKDLNKEASSQSAINKKGLDLTDDAKQEKKDEKQFKKSQASDSGKPKELGKSKESFSGGKDSKQAPKSNLKDEKALKQTKGENFKEGTAKGGFKNEGSNTYQQLSTDARESAQEAGEWLKDKGAEVVEMTKGAAQTVVEKGKEWFGDENTQKAANDDASRQPGEFKQETGEWFNEKCNQVVEKTKDVAQSAIDKGKEWLGETNPADKDDKSFDKEEIKKSKGKEDSKQETGEWLKEKGNEVVEKTKETAKTALDKGQELLDESNKSSKGTKKEGSGKKKEKSGKEKQKQAVNLGPVMFKDNTSVIEPPNENQRSMKENTKELPSIRTAASVGKGKETPQERLQTGKGQFKHDKQASKQDREQIANTIVGTINEFANEPTETNDKENKEFFDKTSQKSTQKSEQGSSKKQNDDDKLEKQSEKAKEEKETKKSEQDFPRGSVSKKRGNLEESGEWKELLNESDRTFTIDNKSSEKKETTNNEDHLQSFISDLEKSQQEYGEERKKHLEMAQDPELSAFERIKAAGFALAEGAMELTEAGRKKIAEFYAVPHTTVEEDEFKGGEKKEESS